MAQNLHPGGTRGPFSYNFESLTSDDIKVSVEGNLKSPSTYDLVYNSDTGGTVTFKNDQPVPPSGADKVRIYRQTSGSTLKHEFQAGSSIRASDLNINDRQALYVAQENRESLNNLALGGASGVGITINGSHIEDGSIDSSKIQNLQVKDVDLSSSTGTDSDRAVTTDHIRDGAVTDAKLATGITGSKVTPNFGSQNIVTTGTFTSGDITISDASPRILFTETDADPDWKVVSVGGEFRIHDETNDEDRVIVNQDGHVDVKSHLDVNGGADVTGNLTVTGTSTFSSDITTNGNDIYLSNGTLISNDSQGAFADRSGDNIDHIWHNDSDNSWNFVSDDPYKATGNSKIRAGSFYGDGSNLTNLLIGVRQVKEGMSTGTSSRTSTSWGTKTSVSLTNTTSSSRVLVISTYRLWSATPYSSSRRAEARTTRGDSSTFAGDTYDLFTHAGGTGSNYSPYHTSILWDKSTSSGTREYKIRYRTLSGTAYISHAQIMAIEFRPT